MLPTNHQPEKRLKEIEMRTTNLLIVLIAFLFLVQSSWAPTSGPCPGMPYSDGFSGFLSKADFQNATASLFSLNGTKVFGNSTLSFENPDYYHITPGHTLLRDMPIDNEDIGTWQGLFILKLTKQNCTFDCNSYSLVNLTFTGRGICDGAVGFRITPVFTLSDFMIIIVILAVAGIVLYLYSKTKTLTAPTKKKVSK